MSIAFDRLCLIVLLARPHAVLLSTCIGVAGCGWPISSRAVRSAVASFMLENNPAVSASAADEHTTLMTPVGVRIGPLIVSLFALPKKKYPPSLLFAIGSVR